MRPQARKRLAPATASAKRTPTNSTKAVKAAARTTAKQPKTPEIKVAIVHDWLIGGGAELVVEQLHKLYPDAPIYTSYCTKEWRKRLDNKVRTGYLQYWPLSRLRKFLPLLRAWWFSHLNLSGFDLVISSSGSGEAKGVRPPHTAVHVNYCHSPTHFCWSRYNEYMDNPGFGAFDWLARIGLKTLVGPFRRWDYKAAQLADYIITNSDHTKGEIQKYYDRSAVVIHPPVAIERFNQLVHAKKRRGFVIAGRQTPYKRFDIAVSACSKLNLPLTVIGDGPEHKRLRKLAGKSVTFLGRVSDEVLAEELASAKGFIFPGIDDFGIVCIEAMAAGTPVIAFKAGGALDYVVPGKTGLFFEEQTAKSLAGALREFSKTTFSSDDVATHAERFSTQRFLQKMRLFIKRVLAS
jgi:glycosyltransferase involved in cell wall biosynthesis